MGIPGFGTTQSPLGVELEAAGDPSSKAFGPKPCLRACPVAAQRLEQALDAALEAVRELK